MLCSAGILFCFKQAEWKQRDGEKKDFGEYALSWLKLKTLSGYCCC